MTSAIESFTNLSFLGAGESQSNTCKYVAIALVIAIVVLIILFVVYYLTAVYSSDSGARTAIGGAPVFPLQNATLGGKRHGLPRGEVYDEVEDATYVDPPQYRELINSELPLSNVY